MPDPLEITLVRHGQSESNVSGRWQGHGDSALSPHGREQAMSLASRLAREGARFDRWVASDLSRAHDTGKASAGRLGAKLEVDPAWREIHVGRWEGLTRDEVAKRYPEDVANMHDGPHVRFGGGESWIDLVRRTTAALDALRATMKPGERAVVFTHGGVVASLVTALFGVPLRRPRALGNVTNTGVTTIRFDEDGPKLLRYNDHLHLGAPTGWSEERREAGATLVSLLTDPPEGYAAPSLRYAHDVVEPETLQRLVSEHAGKRVAVDTGAEAVARLVAQVLGGERFEVPRGVTHVVASEHGVTLADFNAR
ncbi:MAG: histidine phosphatase family protein [Sandaracinus sp.]|nr:histidine phosphatase family protein [Sandaracinus sp.]